MGSKKAKRKLTVEQETIAKLELAVVAGGASSDTDTGTFRR